MAYILYPNYFRNVFTGILLLFYLTNLSGKVHQTPIFNWIKHQQFNPADTIPSDQIKDGCYYILTDRQLNLTKNQFHYHYAYKLISELGVQNNSEIEVEYNPAYQKFYLHSIKIHRDQKPIDYSNKAKIKEIQREEDLERHIYDETKTVYIILDDIRPGDIVEYEYTIEGSNPIFKNVFQTTFSFNLEYNLLNFYFRVVKSNKPLNIKYFRNDFKPKINSLPGGEEWIWHEKNIKGIEYEENIPAWYITRPYIEISEYKSWEEVEKWGLDVFDNKERLSTDLLNEIEKIRNLYTNPKDRLIAVVHFVQRKLRYFGIEIGVNSHKPSSPNKVFLQRYGDCKDKSLLLSKMLNSMGIEAYPSLVSTYLTKEVINRLPSPGIFNHVVVKAIIDGKEYWFDPTISRQEGNTESYYFPNYCYGLVLDGKKNYLDTIPFHAISKIIVQENINIGNMAGDAILNVTTAYHGYDADDIRETFAQSGMKEIQKSYLNYYKDTYDSIVPLKTLSYTDDTINNIVKVIEEYSISDFWEIDEGIKKSSIYPYHINNKLNAYKPSDAKRKSPLYLEYPLYIKHSFKIIFPEEWTIKSDQKIIKNDYFEFRANTRYYNNTCKIEYSLETFSDNIPAEKTKDVLNNIKTITDDYNGMEFTYDKNKSTSNSSRSLTSVLFLLVAGIHVWLARVIYKLKNKNDPSLQNETSHRSIGGWIILPIIGLIITSIVAIKDILYSAADPETAQLAYLIGSNDYNFLWKPYWILYLLIQPAYVIYPVLLLILIFKYDRRVPHYMVYFYFINTGLSLAFFLLANFIPELDTETKHDLSKTLLRGLIICGIWAPYFYYSERVKNTFVK